MAWDTFLKATAQKSPRPLLKEALSFVKGVGERRALDLGAGAMNDVHFLAQNGFKVIAVDSNKEVEKYMQDIPNAEFVASTFDVFSFPLKEFDIVNAQYSLPFNPPTTFNIMFSKLIHSLKKGGIFVGQLFGEEDGWAGDTKMTFHSDTEIKDLLQPFNILVYREEKKLGTTVAGKEKFWHVLHIIAEKK